MPTRHFLSSRPEPLSSLLVRELEVTAAEVSYLLGIGAIYVNKRRTVCDLTLEAGSYVRAHTLPRRYRLVSTDEWKTRIVHEDERCLIVDKPADLPVHATLDNCRENVAALLSQYLGINLLVTQRLDVPTQGLLVLAKTPSFQARFNGWLAKRLVKKKYRALTEQRPPLGRLVHYMQPSCRSPRVVTKTASEGWLLCELEIESVVDHPSGYECEIELLTGRTHQIRAQLSEIGCPILGDPDYGTRSAGQTLALQSFALTFPPYEPLSLQIESPWNGGSAIPPQHRRVTSDRIGLSVFAGS